MVSIYTKTGDKGKTSLSNGKRIGKENCLISALGDLDELNCLLGLSTKFVNNKEVKKSLATLQNLIFNIGAEISEGGQSSHREFHHLCEKDILNLEKSIDGIEKQLPPLQAFILPGGSLGASFLHLARAVCRRVERNIVELYNSRRIKNKVILPFTNRLSDFLFVLARMENKRTKNPDVLWDKS